MQKKQLILLGVTAVCAGLFVYSYYGNKIDKDNDYLNFLPKFAGGLYALNFVFSLATQ